MSEDKLQATIFQWHWNTFPTQRGQLFHVNQKSKNAIEGNRMKAMGVVAGVSDLILIQQGLVSFIELKTDVGTQKSAQKQFQAKVESLGHPYHIIRNLDDFKKLF